MTPIAERDGVVRQPHLQCTQEPAPNLRDQMGKPIVRESLVPIAAHRSGRMLARR
jgi:hypothetical protein